MNNNWPLFVSLRCLNWGSRVSVVAHPLSDRCRANSLQNMGIFGWGWFGAAACETIETRDADFEMALKQYCIKKSG
ncbi:hypothetical protein [Tateyamaria sp.]|uniref:hypothetical protein n=1 Tax=Tateyamaria sp. TaxID=1929288 RepID=UPI0032A0CBE2